MTMRPMTGMSIRHEEQQRPMTGISIRHEEPQRPMTGMSVRHEEVPRPMTGMAQRHDEPSVRPSTGVSTRGGAGGIPQSRGRPMTMQTMIDESPPSSQRSRSRGTSQSPLKGVINEYPEEGITQFCRSDSSSARHGRPLASSSRHSSASSTYSVSEAPTTSTSDSGSFALNTPVRKAMAPPSPKVLQRRTDTKGGGSNSATTSPAVSPSKKSHSFWNFGSKSPKQTTPKSTPSASPMKNSKSMPTGMAMSVPSLDIGGSRTSPGNRSRRGASEEPIAPGASVMLNIGDNVLEVNNPDQQQQKKQSVQEEPELSLDQTDPLMAALEDLKLASKTPRMSSPSKRSPPDKGFNQHSESRNDLNSSFGSSDSRNEINSPIYERPTPSKQNQGMRPSTSQNIRQSQTPPSRGNVSHGPPARSVSPQPPVYDTRRNTLGAPPPAHSAAEMERTRRQYAGQVQQVLNGRPGTGIPRSTSPRPMSRQSTYDEGSYNGRPGSSMGMHPGDMPRSRSPAPMQQGMPPRSRSPAPMHQGMPPRSRSPAPMQQGMPPRSRSPAPMMQNMPPRSRSPAPPMMHNIPPRSRSPAPPRPMSRTDMQYDRPRSRQDSYPRRSVSPAPYSQPPPRGYQDDSMDMRRSPSPSPYPRSISPAPMMARPRSSANIAGPNNPFGISMDRFGNVMDNPPQQGNRNSGGYAYGSAHRHDVDDARDARYSSPAQMRTRSKSSGDLRRKLTEDGRPILFSGLTPTNLGWWLICSEGVV